MTLSGVKHRVFLKVLLLCSFKLSSFKDTLVTEHNKIQGVLEISFARFATTRF